MCNLCAWSKSAQRNGHLTLDSAQSKTLIAICHINTARCYQLKTSRTVNTMSNQQLCGEPPPSTLSLETFIILKQSVKLYVTIDRLADSLENIKLLRQCWKKSVEKYGKPYTSMLGLMSATSEGSTRNES